MGEFEDPDEELVASTPSQRNYKGILIALVVICAVCGLIMLAIQLLRPPDDGPRVKGRKVSLVDISSRRFQKSPFNGTWISSNEIIFQDPLGGVSIFSTDTLTSTSLVTNTSFRHLDAKKYSVSADKKYILLIYEVKKTWEHSFTAKYDAYDIADQFKIPLTPFLESPRSVEEGMELQYAEWGPFENQLVMVYQNDIYYKEAVNSSHVIRITRSGSPGVVFNGIPDWLYEVEVLHSNKALWFSPDGKLLLFLSFNDSMVGESHYATYGDSLPYPRLKRWRYPKAGTTNPEVGIWAVKLNPIDEFRPFPIKTLPGIDTKDHYVSSVQWVQDEDFSIAWTNRVQNVVKHGLCNSRKFRCREIYTLKPPYLAWLDFPHPPIFSKDMSKCLLRMPWRDGNAGYYHHVVWVDTKTGKEIPLSCGSFEVTHIAAWDEDNQLVYYIATPKGKPGERHLYRVKEKSSNSTFVAKPVCLTCEGDGFPPLEDSSSTEDLTLTLPGSDLNFPAKTSDPDVNVSTTVLRRVIVAKDPNNPLCLYSRVTFNPTKDLFVRECLGPGVPTATLHKAPSGSILYVLNQNSAFKAEVDGLGLPLVRTFRVPLSGGYSAPVRLFLPPGFRENEEFKFPLLLHITGSPGSQLVSEKWRLSWASYLTSQKNFIVVEVDGRGSGFQGENIRQIVHHKLGVQDVSDQLEVIKYLKDHLSFIDENNMAVWGLGYGGFLALLALAQDGAKFFKCGIAVAPITKWDYCETTKTERYLGLPNSTENFEGYELGDVTNVVKKFRGKKFLLIHGTADEQVHYQHSLYLTKVLIKEGLPFSEQVYPDEGHDFLGVTDHLYKTMETFLDQTFEKPDWEDWEKANFLGITI